MVMPGPEPDDRFMHTSRTNHHVGLAAQAAYDLHIAALVESPSYVDLTTGRLDSGGYEQFIVNVVRTHVNSPQLLAFLYAVAPPTAAANIKANMLEELGIAQAYGVAHPTLLSQLLQGAGIIDRLEECRSFADATMRQQLCEPMLYATIMELGLAALVEVTGFEYLLSRVADQIAEALTRHHHLDAATVEWFTHHGAVDIGHAEAGLNNIGRYVEHYGIDPLDAETIVAIALRENVFAKRYLAGVALSLTAERAA
jgi:hypothetical protein